MTGAARQFFVSYAGPDRAWAEWVGWQLEHAGHRVELDTWDWPAGDNFVQRMNEALEKADAVVALFSASYFASGRWTHDEWTSALATRNHVVPVAIEQLTAEQIPDILSGRMRCDLHGMDEQSATAALLTAVNGPARPEGPVAFPGALPESTTAAEVPDGQRPRLPGSLRPDVWNVRRRNPDFHGREAQLGRLRRDLLSGRHSLIQSVHGMGGVGKTQIAQEYAHRFASQYDLVWWIDAEQADQLPVHYTELADRLGIAKPEAGTEANARALLQHLRTRQRWLLILDNAEAPRQIEQWLPEGPGHTLITSRTPEWHGIAHQTSLDVFSRADSRAYLQARMPALTPDEADGLADDLGDLPLALAQAAGVLSSGMPLERYRQLVTTSGARILKEGGAPGYPASLAAAVGIAEARLAESHPDAAALLRLGAFLGPDPIPTLWLETARSRLSSVLGDPDDPMWLPTALQPLGRIGLARTDQASFQIHRLTQAVLRDGTDPARAERIREDVTALLGAVEAGDPDTPETWPTWAALASHLTAQPVTVTNRPELRPTLLDAVLFLLRSGQPGTARKLAGAFHEAWSSALGEDHADTLTALQYLGHATSDLGKLNEARPLIQDALDRRRRVLGDNHRDTLQSANDLGVIVSLLGEQERGYRMHEDTLNRRRATLGDDHPDTLHSAHGVASTLHTLGEYEQSRLLDEDTLNRRRRILGDNHPETLRSAHSAAVSLQALGEQEMAHRMHEDTLNRRRATLGDNHPDTLRSAHSAANALSLLGKYEPARRMDEDTLDRRRATLGDNHPDTLHSAHSVAIVLQNLGEYEQSHRMHEDTLNRRRATLGDDHPDTLDSVFGVAIVIGELGRPSAAAQLLEDTLARRHLLLGENHPDTLHSAHSLAIAYHNLRRFPEAVELLEDTLDRRRRLFGGRHPDTVRTVNVLANTLTSMGKRHTAQKLLAGLKPGVKNPKKQGKRRFGRKRR
ncbi:tetratricopeptide repeat protein [Streptomyces sp. HNM0574]|nr:tetratricopeptide repeat protein [Streptomyces sp. HNM0574]